MNTIEELQDKPYGEICTALADIAPQVLEAKARYDALAGQQRNLIAARELISADLRMGDKVRLKGRYHGKLNPMAAVVDANSGGPVFQTLLKDGQGFGDWLCAFEVDGYEKIQP